MTGSNSKDSIRKIVAFRPAGGARRRIPRARPPAAGQAARLPLNHPDRLHLVQKQLIVLLHAYRCNQLELETHGLWRCSLPHCIVFKQIRQHMKNCRVGKNCTAPHCSRSRDILKHWKQCKDADCKICLPVNHIRSHALNRARVGVNPIVGPYSRIIMPIEANGGNGALGILNHNEAAGRSASDISIDEPFPEIDLPIGEQIEGNATLGIPNLSLPNDDKATASVHDPSTD